MRFALAVLGLLLAAGAAADERILEFHSDIRVHADGGIDVTETIVVRAEGNRIRRGIYRDQLTEYQDLYGNRYEAVIEPLSVLRNDAREDFHSVSIDRGIRTYFGHRNRFIDAGVHTYRYRYRASRMLGFFEGHDELYWTVTGFDWAFPIDRTSATVSFAFDVPSRELTHEAYTGPYGARGDDYASRVRADGSVTFETTSTLAPVNGLTLVVGWPKGYVAEPTAAQRVVWLLDDNKNLIVALAGLLLMLIYYALAWKSEGRDPEEGVIMTRYEPPEGYSPASLRYVRQMYYDNKTMTAAIVNLAVKGNLRIDNYDGEHSLTRLDPGPDAKPLATGEKELIEALFNHGPGIALKNENHKILGAAKTAHRHSLRDDYKHTYFRTNTYLNLPAVVIGVGASLVALNIGFGPTPFVIAAIIAMAVVVAGFAWLLRRPTMRGRRLLDEMLGFKDYLEVAEKEELNLRNPPEKTPQLFEAYLPFALALGVDQEWSEKFAAVLAAVRGPDGRGYQPTWYGGSFNPHALSSSTQALSGGLNSAVSSSVVAPGSSSGGGGGGFSGGGGGGGGGGGW